MSYIEQRILKLSKKYNLSHIGSCITQHGPIDASYKLRKPDEPFILSSGHAGLALYCVLESWGFGNAEDLYKKHGTHPNRDVKDGIWASTGSLGHGIGIAVGYALSNRDRVVYVVCSDGETAEGSFWESLRVAGEQRLNNIRLAIVCNGYGAYGKVDIEALEKRVELFYPCVIVKTNMFNYPDWLQGQNAHYVVMDDDQYKQLKIPGEL